MLQVTRVLSEIACRVKSEAQAAADGDVVFVGP